MPSLPCSGPQFDDREVVAEKVNYPSSDGGFLVEHGASKLIPVTYPNLRGA